MNIEQFGHDKFNFYYEIAPAKGNPRIEQQMVRKLFNHPENTFTLFECRAYVHHLVHIAKHYMVVDGDPELFA